VIKVTESLSIRQLEEALTVHLTTSISTKSWNVCDRSPAISLCEMQAPCSRLTASELRAVMQRASSASMRPSRWVVALVRGHLTREPQIGQSEVKLHWMTEVERPRLGRRLPVVLSREELGAVFRGPEGELEPAGLEI
jgi:hypothetical protein